jgi:hypothetical protein
MMKRGEKAFALQYGGFYVGVLLENVTHRDRSPLVSENNHPTLRIQ